VEITEVRIKLMEDTDDRLQGFCSITFDDCFVVRDLKIIEGSNGPFVAMPSRKLTAHCGKCSCKNHLRAGFCNQCGAKLKDGLATKDHDGRAKLYADIAHPINSSCREMIQEKVISEFRLEQEKAQQPDYVSSYDDFYEFDTDKDNQSSRMHQAEPEPRGPHSSPAKRQVSGDANEEGRANGGFGAGIFKE